MVETENLPSHKITNHDACLSHTGICIVVSEHCLACDIFIAQEIHVM